MEPFLLQDWLTLATSASTTLNVIQGADAWLDVGNYEDLVFYLDVKNVTVGGVKMSYETSPTCENGSFLPLVPPFAVPQGLTSSPVLSSYANVPAARYVRWHLMPVMNGWTATFRVWLSAYSLR
jgi:hypothetical protein